MKLYSLLLVAFMAATVHAQQGSMSGFLGLHATALPSGATYNTGAGLTGAAFYRAGALVGMGKVDATSYANNDGEFTVWTNLALGAGLHLDRAAIIPAFNYLYRTTGRPATLGLSLNGFYDVGITNTVRLRVMGSVLSTAQHGQAVSLGAGINFKL